MGVRGLTRYVRESCLYDEVDLQEVADDFKSGGGGEPVIAVDGAPCAWFLYSDMDALHGGQYREFREGCEDFVQRFREMGFRLAFFFDGLPVEEKMSTWIKRRQENARGISNVFAELRFATLLGNEDVSCSYLPEAVVYCASTTFKQIGCEVRLSTTDCDTELARYAASNERCVGVLSNDSDFLIYGGIPCLFTFSSLELDESVTAWRFRPAEVASHLGIRVDDLPIFASFVGNDIVNSEALTEAHNNLRRSFGHMPVAELVAELLKRSPRGDLRGMCEFAFRDNWREGMELVQKSIRSYKYEEGESPAAQNVSRWDTVLRHVEAKHVSREIHGCVFTVMKCRVARCGDVLEDLSVSDEGSPPTGLVGRQMRARMYTVLLWDSGEGPFRVTEYLVTRPDEVRRETVEVRKVLPEGVRHPGLLELWSGPEDRRWRVFSWAISPTGDLSGLRALTPQHLVVPTAALMYLHHEAQILTMDEVRIFTIVAVSVKGFSSRQLSKLSVRVTAERAIYLASLFVRTALHVLGVGAACGLSFPRPADCLLDAYFDGKLFHYIYNKSQKTSNPRAVVAWDKSREETYNRLINIIQSGTSG